MTEKNILDDNNYFDPQKFKLETFADEINVDNTCKSLLKKFHSYLLDNSDNSPLAAGSMASGADYFLRDYMIDNRRVNIFAISVDLIHSFGGNWYIVNNLEPNIDELESFLIGIASFYNYCCINNVIDTNLASQINIACSDIDFYKQRIEDFYNLKDDGFIAWNNAYPLKSSNT